MRIGIAYQVVEEQPVNGLQTIERGHGAVLVDPCEHIDQAGATVGLVFLVREYAAELAEVELVQTLDVLRVDDAVVALDQQGPARDRSVPGCRGHRGRRPAPDAGRRLRSVRNPGIARRVATPA